MKYKVGDRVTCNGLSGIVFRVDDLGYYELLIEFENGNRTWFNSDDVSPDYRALYEQEKALREAAEKMLCDSWGVKCYDCGQFQSGPNWTMKGAVIEWNKQNPINNGQNTGDSR